MRQAVISAGVVLLAAGLTLGGCGGGDQPQTETQTAQPEATAKTAEAYPIDWCVVSGQKLGSMGEPYKHTYEGRTVMFCCQGCLATFETDPDLYLAKLDSAVAGLIKAPTAEPAGEGQTEGDREG